MIIIGSNMKKLIVSLSLLLAAGLTSATEIVKVYSPYNAAQSTTPAWLKILERANSMQNIYQFVLDFKPGGNQIVAIRSMNPERDLAIIAPSYVEHVDSGRLNDNDYVPVHALGDACWALITNKPLKNQKEFVVGGSAFGNAVHLTSLALGEKYKFNVRYIVFKSNNEALINMAGNNGVELTVDKYESYENLKSKNPNLRMVAASCPTRLPQEPKVPTLAELGVTAPLIWNVTMAHRSMPEARRRAISLILQQATVDVGAREIFELGAMSPPNFSNRSPEDFLQDSVSTIRALQKKYKSEIESSSR